MAMRPTPMRALGLCGSLRAASRSRALLEALALAAPPTCRMEQADSIARLPLFNPDLEDRPDAAVVRLKDQVREADVIVVASPEYAHGVTGVLKTALHWLVSYEPFVNKPLALLNPWHRAFHADHALRETLTTMNARLIVPASVRLPVTGCSLPADELARTEPFAKQLTDIWHAIVGAVS